MEKVLSYFLMNNFWLKLSSVSGGKKPILALAPMAGVTDSAFRQISKYYGADVVYTEMVSADGLYYDSQKTLGLLKFKPSEHPVVIQLFGKNPATFAKAAKICEDAGFDGLDINFGCPARKVVAHGGGVTLMRDLPRCREIIEAVFAGAKLPVSIKIRVSINVIPISSFVIPAKAGIQKINNWIPDQVRDDNFKKSKVTAIDLVRYIKDLPISAIMVHGRPHENPFSAEIDYEMIKAVKKEFSKSVSGGPGIVLGNGGIKTPQDAKIMIDKTGVDGLGLARGLYGRPWLFKQIKDYLKDGEYQKFSTNEIKKVILRHAKFALLDKGEYGLIELRKHLLWYVAGWPEAKKLRGELVKVKNLADIKKVLNNI